MNLTEVEAAVAAFESILSEVPMTVKLAVQLVNSLAAIKTAVSKAKTNG